MFCQFCFHAFGIKILYIDTLYGVITKLVKLLKMLMYHRHDIDIEWAF